MTPDASEQGQRLRAMWNEYERVPFPDAVDKDDEVWDNIHPVLLDADIAGLVSHVVGRSKLRHDQRGLLDSLLDDLDWVLERVPDEARPYFARLREMGTLALAVRP